MRGGHPACCLSQALPAAQLVEAETGESLPGTLPRTICGHLCLEAFLLPELLSSPKFTHPFLIGFSMMTRPGTLETVPGK